LRGQGTDEEKFLHPNLTYFPLDDLRMGMHAELLSFNAFFAASTLDNSNRRAAGKEF
jgi:hypothetical protein